MVEDWLVHAYFMIAWRVAAPNGIAIATADVYVLLESIQMWQTIKEYLLEKRFKSYNRVCSLGRGLIALIGAYC